MIQLWEESNMPDNSLNAFIAKVGQGLARTNRFAVEIPIPRNLGVTYSGASASENIYMLCDGASIPGTTVATTEIRTYGEIREMPYERMYENTTLSFYVDRNMVVKKFFDDWMGAIVDPVTREIQYYNDYITDIHMVVMDPLDSVRYGITLHEAYVKAISPVALDWSSRDVMKLSVNINYKYYRSVLLDGPSANPNTPGTPFLNLRNLIDGFVGLAIPNIVNGLAENINTRPSYEFI